MAAAAAPPAAAAATAAHADRRFEEIQTQSANFEHYEKIFQEVIMDLENDEILEPFRKEYEELHASFMKCHDGEKRLIKKCTDLAAEISSCILKVKAAEELSQGDQTTIESLKKEITKAKTKIEQSMGTEVTLKEKCKQLKMDIKELDIQLKKGPASVVGQDTTLADLAKCKVELQKEHDTQRAQLLAIQHDITHLQGRVDAVNEQKLKQDLALEATRTAINDINKEHEKQRRLKEEKDKQLVTLKEDLTKTNLEISKSSGELALKHRDLEDAEAKVAACKAEMDAVVKTHQAQAKEAAKEEALSRKAEQHADQLHAETTKLAQQLAKRRAECDLIKYDNEKQDKLKLAIRNRNIAQEQARAEEEAKRDLVFTEVQEMETNIARMTKEAENDRKQIEDLTRERDILNKNFLKAQSATQRQKEWLMVKENQRRNLDHQIRGFERHAQKQRELIHQLAKEAKTYETDAEKAAKEYVRMLEEVRQKESVIGQKQKEMQEVESRLRQQQTMLDTAENERNLYAKNALHLNQQIAEMSRKFKGMQQLIDSLKTEIKDKENRLGKENEKNEDLKTQKSEHEMAIDNFKKITEKREKTIDAYNDELHKLNQIIAEADAEKGKQHRDHVNVLNERDILGAQLIKRNDELAQLYEQIRIQQSTLRKGEAQYVDRLRDVSNLDFRIQQLSQELHNMEDFTARLPQLKLHLNAATRELTAEQARVRALLEECDNPRNLHRYVRLEGSEPQTRQLFDKVCELQKKLLTKTNEVEKKDALIADKEKLYVELKAIIQRQPGPEVAEQLNVYQDSLQKKTGQLKAMKESLAHFQEQVEHYRLQHQELQEELRELNLAYVAQQKQAERDAARQRKINELTGRPLDAPPEATEEVYVGYTAPPRPATSGDIPALDPGDDALPPPPGADGDDGAGPDVLDPSADGAAAAAASADDEGLPPLSAEGDPDAPGGSSVAASAPVDATPADEADASAAAASAEPADDALGYDAAAAEGDAPAEEEGA